MGRSRKDIQNQLIAFIKEHPACTSGDIFNALKQEASLATIKRVLTDLLAQNLITATGKTKSTRYTLSPAYNLIYPIDADTYFKTEIDERKINATFAHTLITQTLKKNAAFLPGELDELKKLQTQFKKKTAALSKREFKKDFERLAIDLSWKSSQIEGNTYSLLETERLLTEKKTAEGKTADEATMLLNHKATLDFIIENPGYVKPLSTRGIEDIHALLINGLGVERNLRSRAVNITGTNYKPLDNIHQVKEALDDMCMLVNEQKNVFVKAFLVLLLISYIQPFNDGNKRTARIISNAILMDHGHCPLSFRTVDPIDYKKAMLIFYEQNNLSAFKKIFIEQCAFAVENYF